MMRTLAQVLTEEYSEHGVHVANVVIDGLIDSPGPRALSRAQMTPEVVMNQAVVDPCAFGQFTASNPLRWLLTEEGRCRSNQGGTDLIGAPGRSGGGPPH